MTIPNPITATPLLTDADVLLRVRQLVGTAVTDRQLWIMTVDGDGVQSPVVMPVSELPLHPEPGGIDGLSRVLGAMREDLATDLGPGSVILTLERTRPGHVLPVDRAWVRELIRACDDAGIGLRGVFLSTTGGVRRLH